MQLNKKCFKETEGLTNEVAIYRPNTVQKFIYTMIWPKTEVSDFSYSYTSNFTEITRKQANLQGKNIE